MASSSFAEKQQAHHHSNGGSAAGDRRFDADSPHNNHHHHNNNNHPAHHSTPTTTTTTTNNHHPHNQHSGSHPNKSAHSSSLRGTKLARRARSFKDDLMERITQIRTPSASLNNSYAGTGSPGNASLTRPHSPVVLGSPQQRHHHQHHHHSSSSSSGSHGVADMASSVAALLGGNASPGKPPGSPAPQQHDLGYHVRQVKHALKHLRDVVAKNKLEMLPGNGTVVLDTVNTVLHGLKSMSLNEHSAALISATTQVYMSLGRLIKLCDEVLLMGESVGPLPGGGFGGRSSSDEPCAAALSAANVAEVVDQIEVAVDNLVVVAGEQLSDRAVKTGNGSVSRIAAGSATVESNTLQRPSMGESNQRTSLPDIPLTPCERDNLEKGVSRASTMRTSHSTESVLRDASPTPPPKPPLPHRISNPPPLPPKRRSAGNNQPGMLGVSESDGGNSLASPATILSAALDRMSLRSRSPDDNTSILSAGSLDSALNHSRDDDELRALVLASDLTAHQPAYTVDDEFPAHGLPQPFPLVDVGAMLANVTTVGGNQRNSNESGFVSMNSIRGSMLSATVSAQRRASEHCTTTVLQQQQQQQQQHMNATSVMSSLKSTTSCHFSEVARQHSSNTSAISSNAFGQQREMHNSSFLSSSSSTTAISSHHSSNSLVSVQQQHQQHVSSQHASNSSTLALSSDDAGFLAGLVNGAPCEPPPPALPAKTRLVSSSSLCDSSGLGVNVMRSLNGGDSLVQQMQTGLNEMPPPLPVKKKHIMAYMEMLGNCSQTALAGEFSRHSVHTYNQHHLHMLEQQRRQGHHQSFQHHQHFRHISHSTTMSLSPLMQQIIIETGPSVFAELPSNSTEKPPELPPKRSRVQSARSITADCRPDSDPKSSSSPGDASPATDIATVNTRPTPDHSAAQSATRLQRRMAKSISQVEPDDADVINADDMRIAYDSVGPREDAGDVDDVVVLRHNQPAIKMCAEPASDDASTTVCPTPATPETPAVNLLEELDVGKYLVMKKPGETGPDVHGGFTDALIVHASQAQKHTEQENFFAEAFITTFRTFITPVQLIEKLVYRYTFFCDQLQEQKAAKESFALLVRVVNDLTAPDLRSQHLTILIEFVNQLICAGQLICAKLLREKILDKIALFKQQRWQATNPICPSGRAVVTCPHTLLELKSGDLAAQMTLLDAELFQKIEIPELLIWAQAQCEERTPNLTQFTEHFNKMSYWVRSQILWQEDPKERERYLCKFIKVMKHLRKINNYNSYLALLSALNSAPIQRLEWHKTIKESLDDCELFNSSSNYRMYRQVLADASPPCIPYLGLVLQDLTFVHIGNADYLSDGVVNFLKRWLQNNIVESMKRFKKDSAYSFKKNERIINFFDNFENCLDEDALWQISETIKPRGGRKTNTTLESNPPN